MPPRRLALAAFVATSLGCFPAGPPALAEPSATPAPSEIKRAAGSFETFAASWIEKMRRRAAEERRTGSMRSAPAGRVITYRGYGEGFETELRATAHPSAPYVGILRYTERLYSCADPEAKRCSIAATTPVTEIFRFQNGGWVY